MFLEANDPKLKSFIDVKPGSHFPIQNLPWGVFSTEDKPQPRIGVAIGEYVLDVAVLEQRHLVQLPKKVFQEPTLNEFMALGKAYWQSARQQVSVLLRRENRTIKEDPRLYRHCIIPQHAVTMHMPITVGDYTDFYSSMEHARNVGSMFRDKNNPLLPNWKHLPVGYHGRASSVVVSGTPIHRPQGQVKPNPDAAPVFAPTRKLDFELEMAFIVGKESALGNPIPIQQAHDYIFGMVLMNDWSARDIQNWEYVPLGPFVSKSFATSVSPWVVTCDALEPFRTPLAEQEPEPLPYLQETQRYGYDVNLEVQLSPGTNMPYTTVSHTNAKYLYWSTAQQLTHHTITGCNVRVGDLMASGTISGPEKNMLGSLLELTWNGETPLQIGPHRRSFLEDGDTLRILGACQGKDYTVGFGDVIGTVEPARG